MKKSLLAGAIAAAILNPAQAEFLTGGHNWNTGSANLLYANFPITLSGYSGSSKNSVSYKGQMARHALHNSLKKLVSKGSKADMMAYYAGKGKDRIIIDPATKGDFKIKQTTIGELSDKNLKGKTYKGMVPGWVGNMTGVEVAEFMIDKAANAKGGVDLANGYNYSQLVSKFLMGAIFYNQAADNYLDEKLEANTKPNNKAYKPGKAYTGKEHVWDEAFGYFGAPAHALTLTAKQVYDIAKKKDMAAADFNKDGVVDLYTEMTYAHGYYAASFDKGGKTNYFNNVVQAYLDGRNLLVASGANILSNAERSKLKGYANTIKSNWEKVIAESVFKYAGEVYEDIAKINTILGNNGDVKKAYQKYVKHWGEMKGFALALQVGGKDLGETAVKLNRLAGFGPVILGDTQVKSLDANGDYVQGASGSLEGYMLHMLKIQNLMVKQFDVKARSHDQTAGLANLVKSLGVKASAEND